MKPHILLITEKWCDANPNLRESNTLHNIHGSLRSADIATSHAIFYDEEAIINKRHVDAAIKEYVLAKDKIDLVVILPMYNSPLNPSIESIQFLKHNGAAISFIWPDSIGDWTVAAIEQLSSLVDYHVLWDANKMAANTNCEFLWTPQDPTIYNNPNKTRDIDVSFVGRLNNALARRPVLEALKKRGIEVLVAGGQRENYLAPADYADIFQRSKISLNFSYASNAVHQLKGRIFEITMCGALLMENISPLTALRFNPMEDYVTFGSESYDPDSMAEDLAQKIKFLLDNENIRATIAKRGEIRSSGLYNCSNYWHAVLKGSGIC